MVQKNRRDADIALQHEKAAKVRLKAIETQLSLAFTLCVTAETEMRSGEPDVTGKLVRKLRHRAKVISVHIEEPGHVPKNAIPALRKQVTELQKRIEKIDSFLAQR